MCSVSYARKDQQMHWEDVSHLPKHVAGLMRSHMEAMESIQKLNKGTLADLRHKTVFLLLFSVMNPDSITNSER